MAIVGAISVPFEQAFSHGAYAAGAFEPVRDFDASKDGRFVQSKDKASGLPLWVVEVIDADPEARSRTVKVKLAAQVQPVLPSGPAGSPFVPVEFTGMTVTPYVTQAGGWATPSRQLGSAPQLGRTLARCTRHPKPHEQRPAWWSHPPGRVLP